jgi:hypothetical protein
VARHRTLTDSDERQLEALVGFGVRQELAGAVLGVSRATVVRTLARRRQARAELSLEELLSEFAGPFDPGKLVYTGRPLPPPRGRPSWMRAAERVERLEAEQLPGDDAA